MTRILAPRPFSTLGVKPFLHIDESQRETLQREYFRLSRKFHPDLATGLGDDERALLEGASAQLNADYARLKDPWKLLESVVHGVRVPAREGKQSTRVHPEIAADYFELQELLADEGPLSPAYQAKRAALRAQLTAKLTEVQERALTLSRRFPFQGAGDAKAPWTERDLASLADILNEVRYLTSLDRDFESKLGERASA